MWYGSFREQVVNLHNEAERSELSEFLKRQGLLLEADIEYTIALLDGRKIAAVGSLSERVMKCIAVDGEYKNMGLASGIVTNLINEAYARGKTHLFIYTKPENKCIFTELGFYTIAEVPEKSVLMENRSDGIKRYIDEIVNESRTKGDSGAIIVNCNPFTLGHKYLIEYAASQCRYLHVFVLWEEKSCFPAEIRYRLVKEGVRHLSNVILHSGKDYIISNATFPSYFIKTYEQWVETYARLDIEIFAKYIAPALDIRKRFAGEEPYCRVTAVYNEVMQEILPAHGIDVQILPRVGINGKPISASIVRALIRSGTIEKVSGLVPESTYRFLLSSEAEDIIRHIRETDQRH
ncbi:MAG: [citrate [pro-3S]-lyase] ligase [Clostridia bacterium BRH_c25]|nr:MAG: [citrate [pro-3S]-lyase] ligase [Clostridia bacterium BRH_c25]